MKNIDNIDMKDNIDNIIKNIFKYYEDFGDKDYIGEPVTQIEHMTQTAMIAQEKGEDTIMILGIFIS